MNRHCQKLGHVSRRFCFCVCALQSGYSCRTYATAIYVLLIAATAAAALSVGAIGCRRSLLLLLFFLTLFFVETNNFLALKIYINACMLTIMLQSK